MLRFLSCLVARIAAKHAPSCSPYTMKLCVEFQPNPEHGARVFHAKRCFFAIFLPPFLLVHVAGREILRGLPSSSSLSVALLNTNIPVVLPLSLLLSLPLSSGLQSPPSEQVKGLGRRNPFRRIPFAETGHCNTPRRLPALHW